VFLSGDTSSIFPLPRLISILSRAFPGKPTTPLLSRFQSLSIRSLPSLLALLLYSAHNDDSIVAKTPDLSLLVIDDLSTPILANYPAGFDDESTRSKLNRNDHASKDSTTNKRNNILKELANKLASLAAKRNIAVPHFINRLIFADPGFKSTHNQNRHRKQCKSCSSTRYVLN
jgi:hypothetical protein